MKVVSHQTGDLTSCIATTIIVGNSPNCLRLHDLVETW